MTHTRRPSGAETRTAQTPPADAETRSATEWIAAGSAAVPAIKIIVDAVRPQAQPEPPPPSPPQESPPSGD